MIHLRRCKNVVYQDRLTSCSPCCPDGHFSVFVCLVVQEGESFGVDEVFHISHFIALCPGPFLPDKTNGFIALNRTIGRKVAAWPVWPHIQFQFGHPVFAPPAQ